MSIPPLSQEIRIYGYIRVSRKAHNSGTFWLGLTSKCHTTMCSNVHLDDTWKQSKQFEALHFIIRSKARLTVYLPYTWFHQLGFSNFSQWKLCKAFLEVWKQQKKQQQKSYWDTIHTIEQSKKHKAYEILSYKLKKN